MKFPIVIALSLLLGVCTLPAGGGSLPWADAEQLEQPEELFVPSASALAGPPEMAVSTLYGADRVVAQQYGCVWTRRAPDGTMIDDFIADGIHPLDDPGEGGYADLYTAFGPGQLPPSPEGENVGSIAPAFSLDFGEYPPESVNARRWSAEYIGREDRYDVRAEEVDVVLKDGVSTLCPLGDGAFVYEVHAVWKDAGDAWYVFRTIPEVRP